VRDKIDHGGGYRADGGETEKFRPHLVKVPRAQTLAHLSNGAANAVETHDDDNFTGLLGDDWFMSPRNLNGVMA